MAVLVPVALAVYQRSNNTDASIFDLFLKTRHSSLKAAEVLAAARESVKSRNCRSSSF
jgi:cytochrome c peroxidase